MKTNKKCLPILLAVLMVISLLPCFASAAENWTESVLTPVEKTSSFTPNNGDTTKAAVFEWYYDFPDEVDPNSDTLKYYGLYEANLNRYEVASCNLGVTALSFQPGKIMEASTRFNTLGGQRIHGLELLDLTTKERRVWINGVELLNPPGTTIDVTKNGWASFKNVTKGTVAYVDPSTYPVSGFNADGYAAQLTSNDPTIIVGGTKLNSTATDFALNHTLTLTKAMTVAELKAALTASTGAQIAVLDANDAAVTEDATAVTEEFAVQVTSDNEQVIVKYNVVFDLPVENWTESVLTPVEKTSSFTPNGGDTTKAAVFEWYYDFPDEVDPNSDTLKYYGLYEANLNRYEVASCNLGVTALSFQPGKIMEASTRFNTLGGQRIHGLELLDLTTKERRVWINGVELLNPPGTSIDVTKDGWASFRNVTKGTVAYINPTKYPMANFNANGYAAQLTSNDPTIIVGGTKLNSTATDFALNHTLTLTKAMTVAELKAALTASTGAQIAVLDANDAAVTEDATAVTEEFAVQVTSDNEQVIVKYNVVFDLPVENWTESVLTPVEKTSSFTPNGGDATKIAVFEWYYDSPEAVDPESGDLKDYGLYEGTYNRMEVGTSNVGLTAIGYRPGRNSEDNTPYIWDSLYRPHPMIETDSGQRIHVLELLDLATGNRRVWINGVEYKNCSTTRMVMNGSASFRNVTKGTVAYINPTKYPMANFNASGYAAQLTSNDAGVIVGGTKLQDTGTEFALNHTLTLTKVMTVGELKDALTASTGADIAVLDTNGTVVAENATTVTEGFAVQITSDNEQVIVKYNVAFDYPMFAINGENLEVSVIAESNNDLLYLAAYSEGGTVLDKVAVGTLSDGKLVATLKLSEISGKIVKAFHWSNTLQPIEMKEYIPE